MLVYKLHFMSTDLQLAHLCLRGQAACKQHLHQQYPNCCHTQCSRPHKSILPLCPGTGLCHPLIEHLQECIQLRDLYQCSTHQMTLIIVASRCNIIPTYTSYSNFTGDFAMGVRTKLCVRASQQRAFTS